MQPKDWATARAARPEQKDFATYSEWLTEWFNWLYENQCGHQFSEATGCCDFCQQSYAGYKMSAAFDHCSKSPLFDLPKEQPAPTPNTSVPVWELVIADMKAWDRLGRSRYGTPLQAGNGRNAMQDLYEELLDAAVYARQVIEEAGRTAVPHAPDCQHPNCEGCPGCAAELKSRSEQSSQDDGGCVVPSGDDDMRQLINDLDARHSQETKVIAALIAFVTLVVFTACVASLFAPK